MATTDRAEIGEKSGRSRADVAEIPAARHQSASSMAPKKIEGRTAYLQPSRKDAKALMLWLPPDLHKQVKLASVEDELTLQEIGETALRDWLAKRAKRKG